MKSSQKSPVAEKWIINASPVISLARVGQVELLARLPEQAALPQAVAEEISVAPEDDPARQALESGLFKIVKAPSIPDTILAWDLGKGESAVLAYALAHRASVAILDDGAARRCARSLSSCDRYIGSGYSCKTIWLDRIRRAGLTCLARC
jgi:predicted nucleic acid-binding protein